MATATAPVTASATNSQQRIATLDGWRGIAILLVLVGHFSVAFHLGVLWVERIGQHGVAMFFVLSGFLITRLLVDERERSGAVDLRSFYRRRFFRLMPCAWTYLAVIVFLSLWTIRKPFASSEIFGSIFFFRNYVDFTGDHPITGHFWSLSIEEQFYLFWPALLLLLGTRRALRFAVGAACIIAAWRFQHWTEISHHTWQVSTMTQYRADALFVGCALALALPYFRNHLHAWMALPLLGGLAILFPLYRDMIPLHESILFALLLAVTIQFPTTLFGILNLRPLAFLGVISYSVYVWQQLFCIIAGQGLLNHGLTLAALALASLASYYCIERRLIRLGREIEVRHLAALAHHGVVTSQEEQVI